tara:strand:+ start:1527 stop:2642 length:1116 start_codon:yes stop_codon:yes gene_type:complete
MWATERTRKDKRAVEPEMSLQMYINCKRSKLTEQKSRVHEMRKRCDVLDHDISKMNARWHVRLRREKEKQKSALLSEIADIESDSRLKSFENKIRPYVIEANKRPHVETESDGGKILYAPGTSRTPIDGFVEHKSNKKGKTLLNELRTELKDGVPKIIVENSNDCPRCARSMVIQQSKAIICCPSCGYMASYIDSTSMSMSYTDDVEFACFSYKRREPAPSHPAPPSDCAAPFFVPFGLVCGRGPNPQRPPLKRVCTTKNAPLTQRVTPGAADRDQPFQRVASANSGEGINNHIPRHPGHCHAGVVHEEVHERVRGDSEGCARRTSHVEAAEDVRTRGADHFQDHRTTTGLHSTCWRGAVPVDVHRSATDF